MDDIRDQQDDADRITDALGMGFGMLKREFCGGQPHLIHCDCVGPSFRVPFSLSPTISLLFVRSLSTSFEGDNALIDEDDLLSELNELEGNALEDQLKQLSVQQLQGADSSAFPAAPQGKLTEEQELAALEAEMAL